MVKMAYAPLPKLLPIDMSNICSNNVAKTSLSEVLQSDPVKRLFNQPNIIIKAVPLSSVKQSDIFGNKRNGINTTLNSIKSPEISIVPVKISDEEKEDANLLPSKIEDKKSEITLLPVKKKLCGHYEPCENIVCDVTVQQYVDKDGVSPMLAVNIDEDEINAPVAKHCKNAYCDALSIDHNRCRRALIKLHCCVRSHVCDICGIMLKGWKSRISHKNCTRKDEYRHNNVDRTHLLKERMRERELQILEIAKMKKNDYSDPIRAIETLRKNEELIIIPKTAPSQQPIITITSVPSTQSTGINLSNTQSIKINSQGDNLYDFPTSIFRNIPFAISPKNTISDNTSRPIEKTQSINQIRFPNLQQDSYMTSTSATVPAPAVTSATAPVTSSQNQYVRLATSSQSTTVQPLTINNWVMSPSHLLTTTPIQPKPFLTPIRVVPITNLITAPSLLHRTQGIPKFCIMAESLTPVTIPNPPPPQPAVPVTANANTQQIVTLKVPIQHDSIQRRKSKSKKSFFCVYCSKHFSTDWYFKMHVAKHKGEKLFFCNLCDDSFSNKYDMKKHMNKQHNGQTELACDKCDYVCKSLASFKIHVKTHAVVSDEAEVVSKKRKPQYSEDEINHTTPLHNSNEKDVKKIKCEDTSNSSNENKEVSINGKTTQDDSLKSTCVKKHNNEELSTINRDDNAKTNGFVSIPLENIENITWS